MGMMQKPPHKHLPNSRMTVDLLISAMWIPFAILCFSIVSAIISGHLGFHSRRLILLAACLLSIERFKISLESPAKGT